MPVHGLPTRWRNLCLAVTRPARAVCAVHYAMRRRLSGEGPRFVRTPWLETVVLCATLATIGYGNVAPVTPVGRLLAVALMACGPAPPCSVTRSFSSWLLYVFAREDERRPPGN